MKTITSTFLVLPCLLAIACDSDESTAPSEVTAEELLARTVTALGGEAAISALATHTITSHGERFSAGESLHPDESVVASEFKLTEHVDRGKQAFELDYERSARWPFRLPFNFNFKATVNGDQGYIDGVDGAFNPNLPTIFTNPPRGLSLQPAGAARIEVYRKALRLKHPAQLLADAPAKVTRLDDDIVAGVRCHVLRFDDGLDSFTLHIDAETLLPAEVSYVEDDPLLGDRVIEMVYSDWTEAGGVKIPGSWRTVSEGQTLELELVDDITANPSFAADRFDVPAEQQIAFDQARGDRQKYSAQWHRNISMGATVPTYQDFGSPDSVILQEITPFSDQAPGFYYVTGSTHNNVVIELASSLLVVDAPLYTERADALLAKIAARWPGKPIEALILSHFHWDHTGGVRSFVAAGIPIIVGESLIPYFEQILSRPRTLFPDALSKNSAKPVIQPFSPTQEKVYSDGNGQAIVRLIPIEPTHSDGALVVYLPKNKILFEVDYFSPFSPQPGPAIPGSILNSNLALHDVITRNSLDIDMIYPTHGFPVPLDYFTSVIAQSTP